MNPRIMIARILVLFAIMVGSSFSAETPGENSGVRLRDIVVSLEPPIKVTLAIFDLKRFTLRLVDNAAPNDQPRFGDLAAAMQGSDCIAGCNGGFFTREPFDPFGLMIVGGKSFGKFDPNNWLNALLVWREDRPVDFEPSSTLRERTGLTNLLQSGPWLIRRGALEPGLDPHRQARRTFICRDAHENWALGVCEPCSLNDLAAILKKSAIATELKIEDAVNLDGGPSTGLWVKQAPHDFYLREGWPVRNYIGVARRD